MAAQLNKLKGWRCIICSVQAFVICVDWWINIIKSIYFTINIIHSVRCHCCGGEVQTSNRLQSVGQTRIASVWVAFIYSRSYITTRGTADRGKRVKCCARIGADSCRTIKVFSVGRNRLLLRPWISVSATCWMFGALRGFPPVFLTWSCCVVSQLLVRSVMRICGNKRLHSALHQHRIYW